MSAMTRGTSLVADIDEVTSLTGQPLSDLEAGDVPLDIAAMLVTASDAVYDRLEADGIDPTALTNAEAFKRVVAWHLLMILAALGHFSAGEGERSGEFHERFQKMADTYYQQVRPKTNSDSPRRASEGIPTVGHVDRDPTFLPGASSGFYSGFPTDYGT